MDTIRSDGTRPADWNAGWTWCHGIRSGGLGLYVLINVLGEPLARLEETLNNVWRVAVRVDGELTDVGWADLGEAKLLAGRIAAAQEGRRDMPAEYARRVVDG